MGNAIKIFGLLTLNLNTKLLDFLITL